MTTQVLTHNKAYHHEALQTPHVGASWLKAFRVIDISKRGPLRAYVWSRTRAVLDDEGSSASGTNQVYRPTGTIPSTRVLAMTSNT